MGEFIPSYIHDTIKVSRFAKILFDNERVGDFHDNAWACMREEEREVYRKRAREILDDND
jgi:hypothetical protein